MSEPTIASKTRVRLTLGQVLLVLAPMVTVIASASVIVTRVEAGQQTLQQTLGMRIEHEASTREEVDKRLLDLIAGQQRLIDRHGDLLDRQNDLLRETAQTIGELRGRP